MCNDNVALRLHTVALPLDHVIKGGFCFYYCEVAIAGSPNSALYQASAVAFGSNSLLVNLLSIERQKEIA